MQFETFVIKYNFPTEKKGSNNMKELTLGIIHLVR